MYMSILRIIFVTFADLKILEGKFTAEGLMRTCLNSPVLSSGLSFTGILHDQCLGLKLPILKTGNTA